MTFDAGPVRRSTARMLSDYQQRVVDEKAALDAKVGALLHFFGTSAYEEHVGNREKILLTIQVGHMLAYSETLARRIALFV